MQRLFEITNLCRPFRLPPLVFVCFFAFRLPGRVSTEAIVEHSFHAVGVHCFAVIPVVAVLDSAVGLDFVDLGFDRCSDPIEPEL